MILAGANAAQATTTASTTISNLLKQISDLQTQIKSLQTERKTLIAELTRNLALGSSGEDVKTLQEFLASQPDLYPEGKITGYFGRLTLGAVKRFQKKQGLDQAGSVGPLTRNQIRILTGKTPIPNPYDRNANASTSTSTLIAASSTMTICHFPSGDWSKGQTITIGAPAWKAHQKHGDTMGECRQIATCSGCGEGAYGTTTNFASTNEMVTICHLAATNSKQTISINSSTWNMHQKHGDTMGKCLPRETCLSNGLCYMIQGPSTTDKTAPIISDITETTASTTASITWKTNEAAFGKLYYGTANPLVLSTSASIDLTASLSQTANLTGLATGTVYYYLIRAKDMGGNTATSSQRSLATTP